MDENKKISEEELKDIRKDAEGFNGAIYRGRTLTNPIRAEILISNENIFVITGEINNHIIERIVPLNNIKRLKAGQGTVTISSGIINKPLNLLISGLDRNEFMNNYGDMGNNGKTDIAVYKDGAMGRFMESLSKKGIEVSGSTADAFDVIGAVLITLSLCLTPLLKWWVLVIIVAVILFIYIRNNYF